MSYYDRITKAGLIYVAVFVLTLGSFVLLMELIPDSSFNIIILYTIFFGLFSTIFSLFIFRSLFKSFKVDTGDGRFMYISPDLKITAVEDHTKPKEIPEYGSCCYCGKEVYRPFLCNDCGQLVCGKHVLPGDHECRGKASDQDT